MGLRERESGILMNYQSVLAPGTFNNTVAIVTGGGSGIGRCIAHESAALGGHVVVTGRTAEKLERVQAEIVEDGGNADFKCFDIRDEDGVKDAVSQIIEAFGQIDALVNNAGGQFNAPLEEISAEGFEAVVRNNLTGTFLMIREVFTQSMQKNGGAIVNITADNLNGMPGMGHSGAARAGVENLTKTAAWEWAQYGVRINSVAPGWIRSSGFDTYPPEIQKQLLSYYEKSPMKRFGTEAEVSAAVCFLLSRAAGFISGESLWVDGASSLGAPHATFPIPEGPAKESTLYNGFHRSDDPRS